MEVVVFEVRFQIEMLRSMLEVAGTSARFLTDISVNQATQIALKHANLVFYLEKYSKEAIANENNFLAIALFYKTLPAYKT